MKRRRRIPLSEACQIEPPKREARERLRNSDLVSFVPMNCLGICSKDISLNESKPLSEVIKSYTYFADGDVLLAKITPCFENGKLGIARKLRNGVGFGSSEYIVFRSLEKIIPEYLFHFLSQNTFREEGSKVMTGAVGHKRVPKEFIANYQIPLPPLPEQKRIVAIVDKAFEGIDKAIANTEKNLANARELFESYLNNVFSQKGDGWVEKRFEEVCENLDNMRIPITKSKRTTGNIPYYGASGVVDYVSDYIFDEELLLVSEDGANLLARTYPIAFTINGKSWVNNHAHVLRFSNKHLQKCIEYYLNSISLEPYVSGMAQPKLNQKALNSIIVPVPPEGHQQSLVDTLDTISSQVQGLKATYQQKVTAFNELKQSLLRKAFSGDLTSDTVQ